MAGRARDGAVRTVVQGYEELRKEWAKKNRNLQTCGKYLSDIKVELTKLQFLPSIGHKVSKEELLVARNTLEIGALWSIANKDIPSFERYIAMLKIYYMDYRDQLAESPYMYELLGLDLLCLLAQNKVGEFHTTLEHLPAPAITDNVYIRHPVAMEQYLMEGAYNKIYLAKGEVPAEGYKFFIEELLSTIREDIADCVENAYDRIRPEDIGKMLYLSSTKEILKYCETRGWQVGADGYLHFKKEVRKSEDGIPSRELAHQMINYAREMEQIV
ncbi:26S proteasome non-ATPase regulatory subunit 8-like [Eriocheir sinensis]|uniref:26S proteasome non-ATPase regulatory subunit 8-like n=1 Tax=Eriocheir sinensis TaxID=95602 RepID=UPI0021C5CAB9|nr:26S proteasome non-ATPase regulatory subunit 8-like [Eriocheir sinensis]